MNVCKCGCGEKAIKTWRRGHNLRVKNPMSGRSPWNKGILGMQDWMNVSGLHSHIKGEFRHTPESIKKMSESISGHHYNRGVARPNERGEKHFNWKGGISREYDRVRNSVEWRIWREDVYKRDGYVCQVCGKKNCELHPHHIKQVRDLINENERLIYDISNGMTVCVPCHREIHKERGIG
jgi:hypothetical protein